MKRLALIIFCFCFLLVAVSGCAGKAGEPGDSEGRSGTETNSKEEAQDVGSEKDSEGGGSDTSGNQGGIVSAKLSPEELLATMTLEEKIGQMLQAARDVASGADLLTLGLGSVLSGGGSYPGKNTIEDWDKMITGYQKAALKTELQIPFLYGLDAVHGLALVKNAVVFPHNIGLGAANDPELMYQMGAAVAEEMKLIKVLWNFSPCVAVNTDPRWGRTYECYSSDPTIVADLADAYLKGQTDHGVVATAKHYVADGGAEYGTGEGDYLIDRGDASITEEELRRTHLVPYQRLVDSGVKVIMASFSSYNGVKLHEDEYLLTQVLKKEMGFEGFIVTDWEAVNGLSGQSFEENIVLAVNAGVDMLMEPFRYEEAYDALLAAVKDGRITEERINDAVLRILKVKKEIGLFEDPYSENLSHEVTELGSAQYRELAKQLVEESQVLLKNENNVLPLKQGQKIYVVGPAANNMGLQCGGWSLTWQGIMDQGSNKVTDGTTILEGLEEYSAQYGFEIITEKKHADEADVVLLALGEIPYAEYLGDTSDLSITGALAHPDNADAIKLAKRLGKPVIALLVAGRNVLIQDYAMDWDGIVMCYLPGSEGDGIAAVLSGEVPFSGKLAMPYYKSVNDIGKEGAELMYELGYGLTY